MSENKRISNETLGKVVVNVVKDLEKSLKASEKAQIQNQEELKQISNNIAYGLNQEISRLNDFKVDLSPLDDKMNKYLDKLNKVTEQAQNDLKSPMLSMKVIGLFFSFFIAILVFFYFFNKQAKQLEFERAQKQHFIRFIEDSDTRIKDYKNWTKEL